jgi:anhydro-N-acetylmuramic acid kinase
VEKIFVCGGGAHNGHLMQALRTALDKCGTAVDTTDTLGIPPNHVEALAFAWLAHRYLMRRSGNLSTVTGAKGGRILGAFYPG